MEDDVLDALAVFRLTRLVTQDTLPPVRKAREALIEWDEKRGKDSPYAELITCPWCFSMWVSLGLVFVVKRFAWWKSMRRVLAFSAVSGLLAEVSA